MTTDERPLTTSELNVFFDEHGTIGMGGGIHIKLVLPGTPTVDTIKALVKRVHEAGDGQAPPVARRAANQTDAVCPKHGKARKGQYGLYCPTKMRDGSWCKWKPEEDDEPQGDEGLVFE